MTETSVLTGLAINYRLDDYLDELKPHLNSTIYWQRKQLLHVERQILAEQLDHLTDLKQYLS